jgi:hypothetical protein
VFERGAQLPGQDQPRGHFVYGDRLGQPAQSRRHDRGQADIVRVEDRHGGAGIRLEKAGNAARTGFRQGSRFFPRFK